MTDKVKKPVPSGPIVPKAAISGKVRIGDTIFDGARNQIWLDGEARSIEPRLVRLLEELCAAGGEPVGRDDLLSAISTASFAGDEALTQAISKLRQVLKDDPKSPRYIKTIPRKGYALIAPVMAADDRPVQTASTPAPALQAKPAFGPLTIGLLLVIALLLGVVIYFVQRPTDVEIELNGAGEQEFNTAREFIEQEDKAPTVDEEQKP
ncbi:winged helix-turn-helix domain-containing protein [Kordiimonas sp.]|uniref:winged helix-turn-helix domain-containing protein n=1 Tax=Kordiimonas sp. TaxID=1970157 RepID=UPI003A8DDDC5